ncbi:MAG TPA: hypothetical protein VFL76_08660 [Edaphocola sp.]|nr:hypothetical protein [Edaphocola sp.]
MKFFTRSISAIVIFMTVMGAAACSSDHGRHDDVRIRYQSYPFYKDFAAVDTQHVGRSLERLKARYPQFLDFYLDTVLSLNTGGRYTDTNKVLNSLLTYKDYRHLFDTVQQVFPNTEAQDAAIKAAFKNMKYYDPVFKIPSKVYYFISYLHLSAFTTSDTVLGIGLDMFLGRDFSPYGSVGIPGYATIRFTKENIPVWACQVVYENRFPFDPEGKDLLALMIEKGKEIYFLKKCLPDVPEKLLLGFTDDQMAWCRKNEVAIYNFFIQQKLFYQTRLQEIMRYVMDGPNTPGFPPEAPGNLGTYIGWKIVESYAANHGGSLEEVLQSKNPQQVLQEAAYKP